MPRPGAQLSTSSRLPGLMVMLMSMKPAACSHASIWRVMAAPAKQVQSSVTSKASSGGSGATFTTSAMAMRPPGFSTRNASR